MKAKQAWMAAAGLAACLAGGAALDAKSMYKCVDDKGRVTYSNLPCPVVAVPTPPAPVLPCPLTAEQRRNAEHLEGQFLARYPSEERHRANSFAGLQEIVARMRLAQSRLSELRRERKSIDDELAFYEHRPVPPDLQRRLEATDARFAAIADVFLGLENEVKTIVTRYECEHRKFGILWRGGAPGSSACSPACNVGG